MFSHYRRLVALSALFVVLVAGTTSLLASGGGGSGGGGNNSLVYKGYASSIDYSTGQIVIGTSYYTTGVVWVDSNTKFSRNNTSCRFIDVRVGDWIDARVDPALMKATKVQATGTP